MVSHYSVDPTSVTILGRTFSLWISLNESNNIHTHIIQDILKIVDTSKHKGGDVSSVTYQGCGILEKTIRNYWCWRGDNKGSGWGTGWGPLVIRQVVKTLKQ